MEKRCHGGDAIDHPFVHADIDDLGAVLDLLPGNGERGLVLAGLDQAGEPGRAGDIGALADVEEVDGGGIHGREGDARRLFGWRIGFQHAVANGVSMNRHSLQSAEAQAGLGQRREARGKATHRLGDPADVLGRSAAATAYEVQKTGFGPLAELRRQCLGRLGKAGGQQWIGQTGVGICADVNRRDVGQLLHARPKFLRPERAIHADTEQRHVRDGIPKRLYRLAGKAPVGAGLNKRDGSQEGHGLLFRVGFGAVGQGTDATLLEQAQDREEGGLGDQRVKNRLHQQQIHAAVEEPSGLFVVRGGDFVKVCAARRRIVRIGRERRGFVRRPERAGDEAGPTGMGRHHRVRRTASTAGRGDIDFIGQRLQAVIRQRKRLRVESVGLNQVGAGFEVLLVNFLNEPRLREAEQIVQTLEALVPVLESFAAICQFVQLVLLHHGTHRAVEDDDAFAQQAFQLFGSILLPIHFDKLCPPFGSTYYRSGCAE